MASLSEAGDRGGAFPWVSMAELGLCWFSPGAGWEHHGNGQMVPGWHPALSHHRAQLAAEQRERKSCWVVLFR